MAKFGVHGIRHLNLARATGTGAASDLTYTANGAGHDRAFYWVSTRCRETSIRGADHAGSDRGWVDDVALLRIETPGDHEADGQARMSHDIPRTGPGLRHHIA